MLVRELVTKLGFRADNREADKHESSLRKVRRAAVALTAAYTATVGAAAALATRMATTGNAIAKNAQEAGLAVDEYQSLVFAMGQVAQVSDQDVNRALGRLNQRIGRAAREGGKYADALVEMGFSQEKVASGSITTGDAMEALTEQLANARNEQEASAIAGDVLGTRLGRRLGPALFRNSEAFREQAQRARELGGGYSEAATAAGEDFIDTLSEVGLITASISGEIAERLVPAVDAVVSSMVEWWVANRELILQNLRHYMDVLATGFRTVQSVVSAAIGVIDSLVQMMGGWERVIKIVIAATAGLIALKLGGWLWAVAGAMAGAAASGKALRLVMLALNRIPLIALMTGLAIAIEDLITWIRGGDSAIGMWLGSWEDFSATAQRVIADVMSYIEPLIRTVRAFGEVMAGAFALDSERAADGLREMWAAYVEWVNRIGGDIIRILSDAWDSAWEATKQASADAIDWLIAEFILLGGRLVDALTPDIPAVMAGFRSLGREIMDWAKGIGERIAETIVPSFVLDFIGGAKDPASPEAQAERQSAGDALNILGGVPDVSGDVRSSGSGRRDINVNARIDSTLQVPEGTPEEQRRALRDESERTFERLFEREINRTLNNMPGTL